MSMHIIAGNDRLTGLAIDVTIKNIPNVKRSIAVECNQPLATKIQCFFTFQVHLVPSAKLLYPAISMLLALIQCRNV